MDLNNIVGFNVYGLHHRQNFRSLYYSPTFEGEAHSALFFFEKGAAFLDFGKGPVKVTGGHMVCFESGLVRRAWGDPDHPPTFWVINFDMINRLGGLVKPSDIGIPLLFKPDNARAIKNVLRRAFAVWNAERTHYRLVSSMLGLQLLRVMATSRFSPRTFVMHRGVQREDEHIAPVLDFIRKNYKEDLRIETLARKAGLHPAAFLRRFKKVTSLTPRQYILARKIEQAKDHLLDDNRSFSETAENLGFCDYSNFFKTFKKMAGMTPLEYYRKYRPGIKK